MVAAALTSSALPSLRSSPQERKALLPSCDSVSSFTKRYHFCVYKQTKKVHRFVPCGKARSKFNAVDFDAGSSDDENGSGVDEIEEESDGFDWEMEMRKRIKEIEEMKELERKAEELQYRMESVSEEETEEEKKERVKKELEKVAMEQGERRATAKLMYELGQKAYEKGMYGRAIEFLEGALTIIPRPTLFGGEIQIWLAMAYEANNRHKDCIDLYRQLESKHPSVSIRRQAAELRYILQAPKIKISEEELVPFPSFGSSYDNYASTWNDKVIEKDKWVTGAAPSNEVPWSKDFLGDLFVWRPAAGMGKTQVFWVAVTLWLGLVGAALLLQR